MHCSGRVGIRQVSVGRCCHPDRLRLLDGVVVELHLSNPTSRAVVHTSVVAPVADGVIAGFGGLGYRLAVQAVAGCWQRPPGRRRSSASVPGYRSRPGTVDSDRGVHLPVMDVAGRLERLRPLLADVGADALLVTALTNVRY